MIDKIDKIFTDIKGVKKNELHFVCATMLNKNNF